MEQDALLAFESHIDGKNAHVDVFADRIEWSRTGKVSKGKAALGAMTMGASLVATGVRSGASSEMIPIGSLSSVTTEKDGLRQYKVKLISSGNTIEMRVSKTEAEQAKDTITKLMLGTHPALQADGGTAPEQSVPAPPLSAEPAAPSGGDPVEQIKKLAELRDAGLLSDEEFDAKRQQLLDRM